MPKIISRSAVSSSLDAQPTASSAAALRVYYCICGEFILVIDRNIAALPRRKTDNAIVIRTQDTPDVKACVFKLNTVTGDPVLVERAEGHERQYRFMCPRCSLLIAYQSTPPPVKSGEYVYIVPGSLTQVQGQVPADAFEEGDDVVTT
ncbi:hypothetical protein BDV98DRAFT_560918 [Pterulicium gracile]|uniref:STEEP1 domain-containing protein n=1 Tax=Pterulicium gracile TaxID=1884261 RepID=A0A5C3R4T5_9AGAR|nr:hypothetical protein BDV98DRAFT_560918 [Pterula gracilis]